MKLLVFEMMSTYLTSYLSYLTVSNINYWSVKMFLLKLGSEPQKLVEKVPISFWRRYKQNADFFSMVSFLYLLFSDAYRGV